jgi:DNA ligase (NAD+)
MNKKEIQKDYNKKIKLFNDYSKYYYDNSSPIVSDKEFDKLKHNILLLERKHNFLNSKKSPSQIVGYKPSKNFKKLRHRIPMLSLSNAFDEKDLLNFEKKILNFIQCRAKDRWYFSFLDL